MHVYGGGGGLVPHRAALGISLEVRKVLCIIYP